MPCCAIFSSKSSPFLLSTSTDAVHITLHSSKGTCSFGAKSLSSIPAPSVTWFPVSEVNSPTVPVSSSSKKKTVSGQRGWAHPLSATPVPLLLSLRGLRQWTQWPHTQAWLSKCSPTAILPWLSTSPSSPAPPVCSFPKSFSLSQFPLNSSFPLPPFYLPSRQLQSHLQPACQCSQFSKLAGHTALL